MYVVLQDLTDTMILATQINQNVDVHFSPHERIFEAINLSLIKYLILILMSPMWLLC